MINKISKMLKNRKGFTLVELMVVVVIIGILTAIAVPVYNSTQANAEEKACIANLRTMNGALQQYNASEGSPADALEDLVPKFLAKTPTCPSGGKYTYVAASDTEGAHFTCDKEGHAVP